MELRPVEKDVLAELSNVSMGSASVALSSLLNKTVRLAPPEIAETTTAALQERYNKSGILINVAFEDGLEGVFFLFLQNQDVAFLLSMLSGKGESQSQTADISELSAINEAMSITMGSYTTSLASFLSLTLELAPLTVEQVNPADKDFGTLGFAETDSWAEINFTLEIEPNRIIHLVQFFSRPLLQNILIHLNLLNQTESPADFLPALDEYLSDIEKDTMAEVGNISLGASATALSQLVDRRVQITTPKLFLTTMEKFREQYPLSSIIAKINYQKGLQGETILILKEEDAALIAGLMMGLPVENIPQKVGEMEMSAVSEAMNQMIGSAATALSNFLDRKIDISPPDLVRINLQEEAVQVNQIKLSEPILQISFQLDIGELVQSRLIQVIPFSFAKKITSFLLQDMITGEEITEEATDASELPGTIGSSVSYGQKNFDGILSELQKDALAEVGNISLGASATALSELINKKVSITTPQVTLTNMKEVSSHYPVPCLVVMVNFIKGLDGNNVLIIKKEDALVIVGLMMGMEPPEKPLELNELEISAVSEAMNQMMGSAATAMSDFLDRLIDISPPEIFYTQLNQENIGLVCNDEDAPLIQVAFRMEVEGLIDSSLLQLIPLDFAREITSFLLSGLNGQETTIFPDPAAGSGENELSEPLATIFEPPDGFSQTEAEKIVSLGEEEQAAVVSFPGESARKLQDDELAKLNLIRDIPLEVQAVLGKTKIPLKKVFSLVPGYIVALNRFLGEPVELYAHERLVATGEVVLVNGQFGVKITEMVRPKY